MATIREVAKLSGVSTATVSNVLNARSQRVSPQTRERVLAAVRTLRYRPSAMEENQMAISTENLAVVCGDLSISPLVGQSYFGLILDGILEATALRGWSLTLFIERMWDLAGCVVRRSYDGRSDAAIVMAPDLNSKLVLALRERGIPTVLIGTTREGAGVSSVDMDNEDAGYRLATHLLTLGHRRIAYLGPHWNVASSAERFAGYARAMAEQSLATQVALTVGTSALGAKRVLGNLSEFDLAHYPGLDGPTGWADDLVNALMNAPTPPSALLCWNDALARDAIHALLQRDIRVPQEVSVTGCDDTQFAADTHPFLTTIAQPLRQIGLRAAQLAIDHAGGEGHSAELVRFRADLVVRESTAPPTQDFHPSRHRQLIAIGTNGEPLT